MPSIRLGDLLVKAKVVSESQLKAALAEQQKWGGRLGEILVRMSLVTEDMLVKALSKQLNVPAVNLEAVQGIPAHVRAKIPSDIARDLVALPLQLREEGKALMVASHRTSNTSTPCAPSRG
jgi:Type II secretion system (T2SS), protein E, N-terminal domain